MFEIDGAARCKMRKGREHKLAQPVVRVRSFVVWTFNLGHTDDDANAANVDASAENNTSFCAA